MLFRSGNVQRFLDGFRSARDDEEIGAGRPFRDALALLPMAKRVDAETKRRRESLLRETQLRADLPHVIECSPRAGDPNTGAAHSSKTR